MARFQAGGLFVERPVSVTLDPQQLNIFGCHRARKNNLPHRLYNADKRADPLSVRGRFGNKVREPWRLGC